MKCWIEIETVIDFGFATETNFGFQKKSQSDLLTVIGLQFVMTKAK